MSYPGELLQWSNDKMEISLRDRERTIEICNKSDNGHDSHELIISLEKFILDPYIKSSIDSYFSSETYEEIFKEAQKRTTEEYLRFRKERLDYTIYFIQSLNFMEDCQRFFKENNQVIHVLRRPFSLTRPTIDQIDKIEGQHTVFEYLTYNKGSFKIISKDNQKLIFESQISDDDARVVEGLYFDGNYYISRNNFITIINEEGEELLGKDDLKDVYQYFSLHRIKIIDEKPFVYYNDKTEQYNRGYFCLDLDQKSLIGRIDA
jgi:preprotein translocase subunit Sss1